MPPPELTPSTQTIAITGATGLVGTRLMPHLQSAGHIVLPLARTTKSNQATWNPHTGEILLPPPHKKIDTLIHLAGKNIAVRWSAKSKKEIWESRVTATQKLATHLANLPAETRPKRLLAASAIGIYGSRADEVLTEDSPTAQPNSSYMADICLAWEAALQPAVDAGIQVSRIRIGVVLSRDGGALAKLATPTKLGLAGPVGPGTQFMPCISLHDLTRLFANLVEAPNPPSIVNAVGPTPVRQKDFIRALGKLLHRPTVFPLPTFMVKLVFGQMGIEALLSSLRVIPTKLPADFHFDHPTLESALQAEWHRSSTTPSTPASA